MNKPKSLIALFAAIALGIAGAASVAQASDHEDYPGGFRVGPLGQAMGSSSTWGASGARAYGFVPPDRKHHATHVKSQLHD